jgi:hypothetical protein
MVVAPLGPGPGLLGPVVSFDSAEGYRAMARQAAGSSGRLFCDVEELHKAMAQSPAG